MVTEPPQNGGAVKPLKSVAVVLQPPVKLKLLNHVAKAASTAACVSHSFIVIGAGQLTLTTGAVGTVNVEEQVSLWPQSSVAV